MNKLQKFWINSDMFYQKYALALLAFAFFLSFSLSLVLSLSLSEILLHSASLLLSRFSSKI